MKAYRVRSVGGLHALALEDESDGSKRLSLAIAEGIHELLKLGRALDLEEDFVVVVRHLDVEVLGVGRLAGGASGRTTVLVFGRHVVGLLYL